MPSTAPERLRRGTGDPSWRTFYAVLYMTRPFYTQKHADAEFAMTKADLSWRPLVIVGPGARGPKKAKGAAKT